LIYEGTHLKIGIVCYPTVGGSGVLATELGHELAKRGHEVHFITYAIPFRLRLEEENIFFHEVEINQYDLFQYPDYALTLAAKIAAVSECHALDILHVHYAIPHATSAYLAMQILDGKRKPAVVTTLHGTDITLVGKDRAYYEIVKFSIEQNQAVTAVSNNLKKQTVDYFHINKDIDVIHNFFIPKEKLDDKCTLRKNFVRDEEKLIVHASNYRPVKRASDVLKIFLDIRREVPSKLLFLGTGVEIGEIRRRVIDLKIEKDVFFLGVTRQIDAYIACADLFLLPSEQESFGLVALESMAYGVPVVASDVGGLPEVIEHGVSGFLAPCGNTAMMARYAIDLLNDKEMYAAVSQKSAERALNNFSADVVIPQYEELYRRLCV